MMSEEPRVKDVFELDNNQIEVRFHRGEALCRTEHEGIVYITSTEMKVYVSVPLLNLYTCVVDELWLTHEQVQGFRRSSYATPPQTPHPRTFDLPKIGLPRVDDRDTDRIQGFTSASSSMDVVMDDGGHWWCGGSRRHPGARPYYQDGQERDLRFVTPWLDYLGVDGSELVAPQGAYRSNVLYKLTLCSYPVRTAIEAVGMWGHYFPEGEARIDPKLAREEALAIKPGIVEKIRLDSIDETNVIMENLADLTKSHQKTTILLDKANSQIEAFAILIEELETQLAQVKKDKSIANVRIAELEIELKEALELTPPDDRTFSLDRV